MSKSITLRLDAQRYEDHDDSLTAAADAVSDSLMLEGWDLAPRWADDQRNEILVDVPRPQVNDAAGWDALRLLEGCVG